MTTTIPSLTLTEELRRYSGGDETIAEALFRKILPALRQIAVRELRRERYVAPLSPTELIHEIWLRNLRRGGFQVNSREHFYAIAAVAMQQVLVDFARARLAQRRGNGEAPSSLNDDGFRCPAARADLETLVQIGLLMEKLEKHDLAYARIVAMHYFVGFTLEEIAEVTGLTFRQVRHRWEKGRDWLKDRL